MVRLNLVKPISESQAQIAKKCKWKNLENIPVRKNNIHESGSGIRKFEPEPITISTRLNPNNFQILEIIMGNDKLSRSPFVHANLSEILRASKTEQDLTLMQKILTSDTVDKLDFQRTLVKNNPRNYVKDKTQAKYINTPAGLNALFSDVSMLKAAYIMDKESLNALFRMDVTTGRGKAILGDIGRFNSEQLERAKKSLKDPKINAFVLSESGSAIK